jgi:hypothetical protein
MDGHVSHMEVTQNAILVEKPERRNQLGRHSRRRKDNMKICIRNRVGGVWTVFVWFRT